MSLTGTFYGNSCGSVLYGIATGEWTTRYVDDRVRVGHARIMSSHRRLFARALFSASSLLALVILVVSVINNVVLGVVGAALLLVIGIVGLTILTRRPELP